MLPSEWKRKEAEKLKRQRIKPHQKISNTFIESAIKNSTVSALKTIYYIATIVEKMEELNKAASNNDLLKITIETPQMLKFTELNMPDIKRNLKKMQETSISFVDEMENYEEGISLIPYFKLIYGRNKIEIQIFKKIAHMIIEVKNNYSMIHTKSLMALKNKHSLKMLPLLYKIAQYDKEIPKRKKMQLEDFNDFFGTNYKRLNDIEKNILEPVKKELDINSKLSFTYQINFVQLGLGRPKSHSITIDLIEKKSFQPKLF